jgi:hypothetical protein
MATTFNGPAKIHRHSPDPVLTVNAPGEKNAVTFFSSGVEVLKCSDKGFWVRGKKVKVDDREAEQVYNSFKEWLTWQQISR